MKKLTKTYSKTIKFFVGKEVFYMFWSGIVIGIFIGAGLGILVMSMAISVGRKDYNSDYRSAYGMEHS